jgi:hypothetical protein
LSTTYGSRGAKQDSGGSRTTIIDIKERTVRSYSEDTIRTASKPEPPKVRGVVIAATIDTSKGSATSALPSARKGVIQGILKGSSASLSKDVTDPARIRRAVPVRAMSNDKRLTFATSTQFDPNESEEEVIVTDLRDLDVKASRDSQEYRPRQEARRSSIQSDSSLVDLGRLKERLEGRVIGETAIMTMVGLGSASVSVSVSVRMIPVVIVVVTMIVPVVLSHRIHAGHLRAQVWVAPEATATPSRAPRPAAVLALSGCVSDRDRVIVIPNSLSALA